MLDNQRSGNRREGIGVAESDKRKVTQKRRAGHMDCRP